MKGTPRRSSALCPDPRGEDKAADEPIRLAAVACLVAGRGHGLWEHCLQGFPHPWQGSQPCLLRLPSKVPSSSGELLGYWVCQDLKPVLAAFHLFVAVSVLPAVHSSSARSQSLQLIRSSPTWGEAARLFVTLASASASASLACPAAPPLATTEWLLILGSLVSSLGSKELYIA